MAEEESTRTARAVTFVFDKDLGTAEIERLRQQTDALSAAMAAPEAAHHHDVTRLF